MNQLLCPVLYNMDNRNFSVISALLTKKLKSQGVGGIIRIHWEVDVVKQFPVPIHLKLVV